MSNLIRRGRGFLPPLEMNLAILQFLSLVVSSALTVWSALASTGGYASLDVMFSPQTIMLIASAFTLLAAFTSLRLQSPDFMADLLSAAGNLLLCCAICFAFFTARNTPGGIFAFIAIIATSARLFSNAKRSLTDTKALFIPMILLALIQLTAAFADSDSCVISMSAISIVLIIAYILTKCRFLWNM